MLKLLLAAGVMSGLLLPSLSAQNAGRTISRLHADPRLSVRVSVPAAVGDLRSAVRQAAEPAGVSTFPPEPAGVTRVTRVPRDASPRARGLLERADLVIQMGLVRRRLAAAAGPVSLADFLEAVAASTGSHWRKVGRTWVLTDQPGLERLAMVPDLEYLPVHLEALAGLKVLAPVQLEALNAGFLPPGALTARQRAGLTAMVQHHYFRYGTLAPESLDLEGVRLEPQPRFVGAPGALPDIRLMVPLASGDSSWFSSFDADSFRVDPAALRLGAARAAPRLPAREKVEPSRRAAWPAADLTTPALQARVPPGVMGVHDAALAVARLTNSSLVFSSELWYHPVSIPPAGMSAGEVLAAIQEATGGKWRQAGEMLVHEPHPLVERVARLGGNYRNEWLRNAFAETIRSLTRRERDRLREKGVLTAQDLSEKQRQSLRRAAACAFVTLPDISAGALDLESVSVRYLKADRQSGLPPRAVLEVPSPSGVARRAATEELR